MRDLKPVYVGLGSTTAVGGTSGVSQLRLNEQSLGERLVKSHECKQADLCSAGRTGQQRTPYRAHVVAIFAHPAPESRCQPLPALLPIFAEH
jgi:hypothetical protein